jgi:hypothetical protein
MFSLFKGDPIKKLTKQRLQKLEQAMQAQRNGDMCRFAELSDEAEKLMKQIEQLQ